MSKLNGTFEKYGSILGFIVWLLLMAGFALAAIEYHGHPEYVRKDVLDVQLESIKKDILEIKELIKGHYFSEHGK